MSLNVILPNLSLAFSSVTFYQVARILLTPCVALMNFVLYKATLPRNALLALIPACAGVGMVSYYDSLPASDNTVKTTSGLGVVFAFSGIFASSLYTVWIGAYHRKLQMSSMQLLFNQAPVSAFMLLYVIPFVDTFPVWSEVPVNRWLMILIVSLLSTPLEQSPGGTSLASWRPCMDDHPSVLFWARVHENERETEFPRAYKGTGVLPHLSRGPRKRGSVVLASRIGMSICIRVTDSISLLFESVWWLRCAHQHLAILHHRTDRPRIQHRRGPRQDVHHCRPGLDVLRQGHR